MAVLPFENLTGEPGQEYLTDGITEEMITQLGNLNPERLAVIARTSAMHYKNGRTSVGQIARELGVQYVLEGSVRRDLNHVRITAQLIQTKDQSEVWAREYDRELTGLLTLQSEVAREIADEIELPLGNRNPGLRSGHSGANADAYDFYARGQYHFSERSAAELQKAIGFFQEATSKDPSYARAYAAIADCYALLPGYSGRPQPEFAAPARSAALRALQIDPNLPEAHTALALIVQNYDWDWPTAEKEFRHAIELNPNYATAHHYWYAEHLMWRGRFDEALAEIEKARQLDPLSLIIAADTGAVFYFSRQYDRAIQKWRSVLDVDPNFTRAHLIMAAYAQKGMFADAVADMAKLPQFPPAWRWSHLAYINGRARNTAQARYCLSRLLTLSRREQADPITLVLAYTGIGDRQNALSSLEKAFAEHSNQLTGLKVDPIFDPLRGDPRFEKVVREVGLAP